MVNPLELRYAQASMKDQTRDGTPISEIAEAMLQDGYDPAYPIRVVEMPRGSGDSPVKTGRDGKLVSFDTRRLKAARQAAREAECWEKDTQFHALAIFKKHDEPAEEEYEHLHHLTFKNQKIPKFIREKWITAWNEWHREPVLKNAGIRPRTWGHLVKLRMAMSMDSLRSEQAHTKAGFKKSPYVRKTRAKLPGHSYKKGRKLSFN